MDIKKRKIMFRSFIVAFFILSFLTIVYAQGYRFNLTWPPDFDQTLQKTGMLLVETNPQDAKILLDGKNPGAVQDNIFSSKDQPVRTPAKIKNLKPDTYDLKIQLQNHYTWKKEIRIHPGRVTSITDLRLIGDNLPLRVSEDYVQKDTLSPNGEYVVNREKGHIINLDTENVIAAPLLSTTSPVRWSPDSTKILSEGKIFDVEREETVVDYKQDLNNNITNMEWGADGEKIYYWDKNTLKAFNRRNNSQQEITTIPQQITDYLVGDNYIYIMSSHKETSLFRVYPLSGQETVKTIEFPDSSGYVLKNAPQDGNITVHDEKYNTLYLIQPLDPISPLRETVNNVKFFQWEAGDQMIYGNDFEIWRLNTRHNYRNLITRISTNIQGAIPDPQTGNIIYYTSQKIKMIEQRHPQIKSTTLTKLSTLSDVFWGPQQEKLFFNSEIGNHKGLYKLNIY